MMLLAPRLGNISRAKKCTTRLTSPTPFRRSTSAVISLSPFHRHATQPTACNSRVQCKGALHSSPSSQHDPMRKSNLTPRPSSTTPSLLLLCAEAPVVLAGELVVQGLDALGLFAFAEAVGRRDLEERWGGGDEPLVTELACDVLSQGCWGRSRERSQHNVPWVQ